MMLPSRRCSSETVKSSAPAKPRRSLKKDNSADLFRDGLNWDKYLQICNLPAAPDDCFTQSIAQTLVNNFKLNEKLEAEDPRNPSSICLATVVGMQGPRILLRLDGSDKCNDFWRLVDSDDIYMLGTHESKGGLLTPPLGYTKNVSTWHSFLAKNRVKGDKVPKECFLPHPVPPSDNMFELGMKLEAVDKKNPDQICPATVGDVNGEQIFISFDGWRGAIDYWCHYTSRDIFPVGWCSRNDHPLTSPGNKGDNPSVVARLKKLLEESKRQTRSGTSQLTDDNKFHSGKVSPLPSKISQLSHLNSTKIKSRGTPHPLIPVPRKSSRIDKMTNPETKVRVSRLDESESLHPSSHDESSVDEDSYDSSSSSSHSIDSQSSQDESQPLKHKKGSLRDQALISTDGTHSENSSVAKTQSLEETSADERKISKDEEKRKLERKAHKKRKKLRRSSSKYVDSTSDDMRRFRRKRFKSTGDEEYAIMKMKKRKKRQNRSVSSVYDSSPRKRMLGFGVQTSAFSKNSTQNPSIQSPSFLDHSTTPTSLFGFKKDDIVKKATTGWPSGFLVGGPGKVVTSDNKLGRFGAVAVANSSCQTACGNLLGIKHQEEEVIQGQVSTTTKEIGEDTNAHQRNSLECQNSTSTDNMKTISSHTVSSTTHPMLATSPPEFESSPKENSASHPAPAPSALSKMRSRNPQRWSVTDVIDYIRESEPALSRYVHLFKVHEIDGQALLLLNSEIAVKYMSMKLGPALKLASLVQKIKQLVPIMRYNS